jgi:hypothetical protein
MRSTSHHLPAFVCFLIVSLAISALPVAERDAAAAALPAAKKIAGLCPHSFGNFRNLAGGHGQFTPLAATTQPVPLSTCAMNANHDVVIGSGGCGPQVYVDKSLMGANGLGAITIKPDGILVFLDNQSVQLDTAGIVVQGTLEAGNPTCSIGERSPSTVVTINFTDQRAVANVIKGIAVAQGGTLMLYGATGVASEKIPQVHAPSWSYLAQPAGPPGRYGVGRGVGAPVAIHGDTVLTLADKVDWQADQWIVVAGTDFAPDSAEFVQIAGTSSCAQGSKGQCTITLNSATPLIHYHFGGAAPSLGAAAFKDGPNRNWGVDERAEVGLISRNVKLTAAVSNAHPALGGEIMITNGFKQVAIQGVEIEKFGKGQLGSYPIHFHQDGNVTPGTVLINSNSIHHSYNKCVVIHDTNGVTVANTVCARAVGSLFYFETGTETNNTLQGNLGIGAMSNGFTTTAAGQSVFWDGDYLTNDPAAASYNGYNGYNIPFTEAANGENKVIGTANTPTGFWITNPGGNRILDNSIAGCQDLGRGFWILPANPTAATTPLPHGAFDGNRAHGCYTGFDTAADDGVAGPTLQLYTPQGLCKAGSGKGTLHNCDVITKLSNLTTSRNRNRGIWVRASWYELKNIRVATDRDGVSVVSSGGTEGSPPGIWSLVRDAIFIGASRNNVDRFGPCPYTGQNGFGGPAGCYEPIQGNGYPAPTWNMFGLMFYDGPGRIEHAKFVNFNQDIRPYLDAYDLSFLNFFSMTNTMPCGAKGQFQYEGDAAIGWFQSNANSYPPTQYTQDLIFDNVDLRHEIYTQSVENTCAPSGNGGNFRDGDKFTVILDHDQTLTDLKVVPSTSNSRAGQLPASRRTAAAAEGYPISLNNLPFLAGPGTVDECLSTGQQDAAIEGRPTSLISPYPYATIEFSALTSPCNGVPPVSGPNCLNNNIMVFTKDEIDYPNSEGAGQIQFKDTTITADNTDYAIDCGAAAADPTGPGVPGHACVALSGRNGNGIYEPKFVNGLGYTVQASAGMPNFVSVMYGDADLPSGISSATPFHTRLGICYKNQGSSAPPASAFTVYKGSKSFAGPNGNTDTFTNSDPTLQFYVTLACQGLDNVLCGTGESPYCFETLCPSAPYYAGSGTVAAPTQLTQAASITDLTDPTKCPNGTCYFYDQNSGLLFLNLVQEQPNSGGPYSSPLGSCTGAKAGSDPGCAPEDFYSCPGPGCELYTVMVDSSVYKPSAGSDCTPYGGADDYTQPYPTGMSQLAYPSGTIVQTALQGADSGYPHRVPTNAPTNYCPSNAPATPAWPATPSAVVPNSLQISVPAVVTSLSLSPNVTPIVTSASGNIYQLVQGQTYTLSANAAGCATGSCSCMQSFTVTANGWTSPVGNSGENCCAMGPGGSNLAVIGVGAPPYSGQGCTTTGPAPEKHEWQ